MKFSILLSLTFVFFMSCSDAPRKIDLLITNGTVYTCDTAFSTAEAIAVDKGKILETGTTADLQKKYQAAEIIDARQRAVFPGFIDAHAHFLNYGVTLQEADLVGTKSWQEVVDKMKAYAENNKAAWIIGRGWDQNDWDHTEFPDNTLLNKLFPDHPVLLGRIDGHAAIANKKALDMAGVKAGDTIEGGKIELKNGVATGVLIDNAISLVSSKVPAPTKETIQEGLLDAQKNCFAQGLTSVHDCGLSHDEADLIDQLQKSGKLKMKMYVMLSDAAANYDWLFQKGIIKTDRLHIQGFKVYADGALGSRGACLIHPYSDAPGWYGFLLSSQKHFDSVAKIIYEHGFQMCTHAIGDSGNRVMLETYSKYLKGKNDRRWRIEHAQVVDKNDFHFFGDYSIIPSVQPTHATSDMYWAEKRLGPERVKYAYANKSLLQQNGWIPLGTDFPVEDISPFKTFYAAVFRQDASGYPDGGFQMDNALSRKEALWGMTLWAAKAAFEEKEKGSIEKGKDADIIILDQDLVKAPEQQVLSTKVWMTLSNGEKVYESKGK